MITGKSGGTGKYSFREASSGNLAVKVTKMPETLFDIRLAFLVDGSGDWPVLKISQSQAILLWAALNDMAQDLDWKTE